MTRLGLGPTVRAPWLGEESKTGLGLAVLKTAVSAPTQAVDGCIFRTGCGLEVSKFCCGSDWSEEDWSYGLGTEF
jgi:hypothetical protein